MDIARYSIKNPVNVWLLVVVLLIGGSIALNNIGRLEDPAFTIKQVQVVTQFPGAGARKVEREITEPLEIAIQQMSQLHRLTSISKPGVSEITVEVKSHYDSDVLPQIWDELRKRLRDAGNVLPTGAQQPRVFDDFGDVFGMYYALSAPDFSPNELREFARVIRRELLVTEGVAKVQVNGVQQEQLVAYINPFQLAGLGISFPDLTNLLAENLKPFNGGRIQVEGSKVRLLVENPVDRLDEIYNLTLVVPGTNRSIKIRDVAELTFEPIDVQPVLIRYKGEEAITLAISALNDVNIVEVGKRVNAKTKQLLNRLPAGITLTPIYDQAALVDESVKGFINNLILSVTVVTLTLMLFMGWRSGVVVGSVLLVTVMGTVLLMWLMGLQLQRISLGAMVIAMGMLVDNAIVVAEGMMLRMRQGKSAVEAASFIVKRTQWPLLGATVIGIAAFSGIGLSDDATGEFLFSLFAVVLISLLLSWVLATTVVPLFGKYFYQVGDDKEEEANSGFVYRGYLAVLTQALRFRWLTVACLLVITLVAYGGFGMVKQGFFPASNAPLFFVHYWGPQSQDIRETADHVQEAEKLIMQHQDVVSVTSFIGRGADRFTLTYAPQQPNESYGFFLVRVAERNQIDGVITTLTDTLPSVDLNAYFYTEKMQFGPGGGAKLAARFSGPDAEVLRQLAEQAKARMLADEKLRDVRHNWREKGLALNAHYDSFNAGIAGVSRTDFSQAIQYASTGVEMGRLQDGDYSYSIRAKMSGVSDSEVDAIENSQVWSSAQRRYVPFRQISKGLELINEETQIHRRNRIRTITVFAEPGFSETAAKALARLRPQIEAIPLPDGYQLEWGGEYESSRDAQKALGVGLPIGFLVMFLISVVLFGRVRQPLIIWLIVPMAAVGVVSGLLVTDMPFGFMSLLGFLSLFGMLIKNAIVLLEEIDLQIEEGKQPDIAIVSASASRLRPVTLAAITTILGMAPLLTDAFFADMSVTIMGGLAFATVLTLIAVPVFYSLFYRISFRKTQHMTA
ncbi:efflux RND transporter permease subunit [Alteromonas sediminis]|uniref:Efflux RND transporter permease subunit n=1 Tax=Alteromonas sediminis TaxID=2259342 RepID=A0A3N5XYY4_9ALTE|nr:efflux RND transporter permease subunit [Alteromonas sediminis]RPJ65890.1 efflux RND transporter permease subunit [Alteromonas sediminis]